MTEQTTLLEKLKKQETALKKKIREAQKVEDKKTTALHDNKCRAIGSAILAEMDNNPAFKETVQTIIEKHTMNKKDRTLLGLSPLSDKTGDVKNKN